jgi:hypothetical protein
MTPCGESHALELSSASAADHCAICAFIVGAEEQGLQLTAEEAILLMGQSLLDPSAAANETSGTEPRAA